jgi:hypothetical protein
MIRRIGHRRPFQLALATALVVLGLVVLPPAAEATGGRYNVVQCYGEAGNRGTDQLTPAGGGNYIHRDKCGQADARLEAVNAGNAVRNQGAWWAFNAPPATLIREFHVTANLRSGSGHKAQLAAWNGNSNDLLAEGPSTGPQWVNYHFGGLNHPAVVMLLQCQLQSCNPDGEAHMYARAIDIHLVDNFDPTGASVAGSVLGGGWIRGGQSFTSSASDSGSGVWRVDALVNGQHVGRAESCNNGGLPHPSTKYAVPCPFTQTLSLNLDTAQAPFRNGENTILTWATDWSGNPGPGASRTVMVDNALPAIAFADAQDPDDPELIRAPVSDDHSGVAEVQLYLRPAGGSDWTTLETKLEDGEARARVDSAALPPGTYEFRATATDVAGNRAETTARQSGDPMKLTFPLREPVEIQAHLGEGGGKGQTVPYRTDSSVSGRLVDAEGDPIAGKEILVDENFGEGALIRHRPTTVTTNDDGRFSSKIPAGPTRRVTAEFAGSRRYAPAQSDVGELTVKSRASFALEHRSVPEGSRATFKGKVGHIGARIPSGGKLLELQVRLKTGRWDTIGQAFRSKASGRYTRHYRFGKHYTQDALFRFRVKVLKERNRPYRRGASKQRTLIVRAR